MKKLTKPYIAYLLLMFILMIGFTITSMLVTSTNIYKYVASSCFLIVAFSNYFIAKRQKIPFFTLLLIGLFFGTLGDIGLTIDFIIGAVFFAIGHVFYYLAFCFIQKPNFKDFIPGIILFIGTALVILLCPWLQMELSLKIASVAYSFVICMMMGKAITLYLSLRNKFALIILIGTIMFCISDFMVVFGLYSDAKTFINGRFGRIIYFPGQYLLALVMLIDTPKAKQEN